MLTAFEPFGGETTNPSWELASPYRDEPARLPGLSIQVVRLPVARDTLPAAIDAAIEHGRPDAVLALGQATGRDAVCLEAVAVNRLAYGDAVDNLGLAGADHVLDADGPARLHATLPVVELTRVLRADGHPVRISRDAGRFLCNALLYRLLRRWPGLPAAFVHLPLLPAQSQRRGRDEPSLPEDVTRPCLEALLRDLARHLVGRGRGDA